MTQNSLGKLVRGAALLAAVAMATPAFAEDDRYIVKFNPGRSASGKAALRGASAQVVLELGPQGAVAARIPAHALSGLQNNPNIEYIEVDQIRAPLATWNDTTVGGETTPYGIQMVQALQVTAGPGTKRVCIIDSGYSQQQADLRDDVDDSITQKAADSGSGTWDQDSCGHGTHVAGTVAAVSGNATGVVGVYPTANLHIVKVFGDDILAGGNCAWTYSSNLVNALNNCVAAGSNVVSMSLGGSMKSRTEDVAFKDAYNNRNVLSIAAAGNAGNTQTSYPAGYASVVSVAAVDANEVVADFSQKNRDVEIAAPGVGVLSTTPWMDANSLKSSYGIGTTWSGGYIEGAARTPTAGVTGDMADGGKCLAAGSWSGKVVLCQRGDVSFADKLNNVKTGGGVAAVVYNNAASDASCADFAGTLGDGVTSTIPGITLSCTEGAAAVNDVTASGGTADGTVVSQVTIPASGYEAWNGTSMATPHVSGVAALIWSNCPGSTNAQVRDAMNKTALDRGAIGRDNSYGNGIVQAKKALDFMNANSTCN